MMIQVCDHKTNHVLPRKELKLHVSEISPHIRWSFGVVSNFKQMFRQTKHVTPIPYKIRLTIESLSFERMHNDIFYTRSYSYKNGNGLELEKLTGKKLKETKFDTINSISHKASRTTLQHSTISLRRYEIKYRTRSLSPSKLHSNCGRKDRNKFLT